MKYFDLHCDVLSRCLNENLDFKSSSLSVNEGCLSDFSEYCQCFAVWTPPDVIDKIGYFCRSVSIFENEILTLKSNEFLPILTIEGADFLSEKPSLIEMLSEKNVFSLSMTWNYENSFAGGALSDAPLKQSGIDLIREMNERHIVLDVSHLNRRSFFSAIEYADNIVASHSFIDSLCQNKRNLTLEQMKLIKDKGGLIGLCFYPDFLGSAEVFERILSAIDFCGENDLIDIVAFGSDFDGADIPVSLCDIPAMFRYLSDRGISADILESIFFRNAYNYRKSLTKEFL